MTVPTIASADPIAVAAALKRRRRQRRWAMVTAAWTVLIASLPNVLQIEPHPRPVRLDTVRLLGPLTASGGRTGPARVRAAGNPPAPISYGAFREARPSALDLGAGRGAFPGLFDGAPTLTSDDPANDLPPRIGTGPLSPATFSYAGAVTPIGGLAGGGTPVTPVIITPPPTTPVTTPPTDPVPTTPVITPPVTVPVVTPPVIDPPPTPPPTPPTTPGTPPVIVPPVTTPPITSPPVVTPEGPPVVTVVTPIDPSDPGVTPPDGVSPIEPGAGPAGVPEPAVWVEMIAGFAALGLVLRRRRQPPTTLRARSSALTVASRLG